MNNSAAYLRLCMLSEAAIVLCRYGSSCCSDGKVGLPCAPVLKTGCDKQATDILSHWTLLFSHFDRSTVPIRHCTHVCSYTANIAKFWLRKPILNGGCLHHRRHASDAHVLSIKPGRSQLPTTLDSYMGLSFADDVALSYGVDQARSMNLERSFSRYESQTLYSTPTHRNSVLAFEPLFQTTLQS